MGTAFGVGSFVPVAEYTPTVFGAAVEMTISVVAELKLYEAARRGDGQHLLPRYQGPGGHDSPEDWP